MSLLFGSSIIVAILLVSIYLITKPSKNNKTEPYHSKNFNHFINTLKKIEQEDHSK